MSANAYAITDSYVYGFARHEANIPFANASKSSDGGSLSSDPCLLVAGHVCPQGRLRVALGGYPIPLSGAWTHDGYIKHILEGDNRR